MMERFVAAYYRDQYINDGFAFRTAIHVGALLINTGKYNHTSSKRKGSVVSKGVDLIVRASERNRKWFETGDLACLFKRP